MSSNNTRIAKNTLFLYFRMLFTVVVGLYTSRVILQVLGIEDFGIYNVVGGVVMMFSFLNSGMVASSQRFISYELGRKNIGRLKKVFSTSISIHILLALLIFLLAETVGLWFLNARLNIAAERMFAANWIYQCSILTFMLTVVNVPYNACIVAHEHMKTFAYISILEVFLKLVVVIVLPFLPFDKLIVYSSLVLLIALVIRLIYGIYCSYHFEECKYHLVRDKSLFTDMFSFAGWSFIGNLGFTAKAQGINILINLFFGTAVNAARGIAYQVSSVIGGFMSTFQMALNPQITKRYASGEIESMFQLVFCGAKYSFFLLMIIVIPFYIRAPYVLQLWLGIVPNYTVVFLRLVLIMLLIDSMATPLVTAMQATGRIRNFQLVISLIMLANLPISYIVLKSGGESYSVMYVAIVTSLIGLIARLCLLNALVPFDFWKFMRNILLRNFIICALAGIIPFYASQYIADDFCGLLIIVGFSLLVSLAVIYSAGLEKQERSFFVERLRLMLRNRGIIK